MFTMFKNDFNGLKETYNVRSKTIQNGCREEFVMREDQEVENKGGASISTGWHE